MRNIQITDGILRLEGEERAHSLKTLTPFFEEIWSGYKLFEVRLNDRDFKSGDVVRLEEIRFDKTYTGRRIYARIGFVLPAISTLGIIEGYCVFTLYPETIVRTFSIDNVDQVQDVSPALGRDKVVRDLFDKDESFPVTIWHKLRGSISPGQTIAIRENDENNRLTGRIVSAKVFRVEEVPSSEPDNNWLLVVLEIGSIHCYDLENPDDDDLTTDTSPGKGVPLQDLAAPLKAQAVHDVDKLPQTFKEWWTNFRSITLTVDGEPSIGDLVRIYETSNSQRTGRFIEGIVERSVYLNANDRSHVMIRQTLHILPHVIKRNTEDFAISWKGSRKNESIQIGISTNQMLKEGDLVHVEEVDGIGREIRGTISSFFMGENYNFITIQVSERLGPDQEADPDPVILAYGSGPFRTLWTAGVVQGEIKIDVPVQTPIKKGDTVHIEEAGPLRREIRGIATSVVVSGSDKDIVLAINDRLYPTQNEEDPFGEVIEENKDDEPYTIARLPEVFSDLWNHESRTIVIKTPSTDHTPAKGDPVVIVEQVEPCHDTLTGRRIYGHVYERNPSNDSGFELLHLSRLYRMIETDPGVKINHFVDLQTDPDQNEFQVWTNPGDESFERLFEFGSENPVFLATKDHSYINPGSLVTISVLHNNGPSDQKYDGPHREVKGVVEAVYPLESISKTLIVFQDYSLYKGDPVLEGVWIPLYNDRRVLEEWKIPTQAFVNTRNEIDVDGHEPTVNEAFWTVNRTTNGELEYIFEDQRQHVIGVIKAPHDQPLKLERSVEYTHDERGERDWSFCPFLIPRERLDIAKRIVEYNADRTAQGEGVSFMEGRFFVSEY